MQRHGWILNAHCYIKEAILKRLHTMSFHLCDTGKGQTGETFVGILGYVYFE